MTTCRILLVLLIALMLGVSTGAQQPGPAPTLIPPTPLPSSNNSTTDRLISASALARIQANNVVRVGVLFNQPPFGELNIRGEVVGYDADLARALAATWEVEIEFVQVTRQTAHDMLLTNQIDLLIAAQVHRRQHEDVIEYSQPYFLGEQAMMVRLDEAAANLNDMANRRIGVVIATSSEQAARYWQTRTGLPATIQPYLTIDQALVALVNNEVDGVVDKRYRLRELLQPDTMRVIDGTVQPEPYAIALRRQDASLRHLVNHTLQFLATNGRIAEIHAAHFPFQYPENTIRLWDDLGDTAPTLTTYQTQVVFPEQYTIPQMQTNGVLRIAGVPQPIPDAPESERRLAQANAELGRALAARWNVTAQFIPGTTDDPAGAVARGDADIALGVRPSWQAINQVDFTDAYLLRGKRLMTTVREDITSLSELRGKWVGVFAAEPEAADLVIDLGQSVNANLRTFTITREDAAAVEMLEENNVDVVFGDSLRLLPHIQADPETLKFSDRCPNCDPWYTRDYYALAVPPHDVDFRLLTQYTLQELALSGTLAGVLQPVTVPGQGLSPIITPGDTTYQEINFGA